MKTVRGSIRPICRLAIDPLWQEWGDNQPNGIKCNHYSTEGRLIMVNGWLIRTAKGRIHGGTVDHENAHLVVEPRLRVRGLACLALGIMIFRRGL